MAEDLLREEGFAEVRYVEPPDGLFTKMLADGGVDISMESGFDFLPLMDAGKPLTVLAGVQVGCFELRANDSIRTIADLRGKRVAVTAPFSFGTDYLLVSAMAAYVGLDPAKDIAWVANPDVTQVDLFKAGEVDAFIGFPPSPKQPCVRDVGHVVVNTATDPPWSDYFCCMATANGDFVRNHPVATKRALRALLRATDICHREPERAAQRMVDAGFSAECAAMILKDARYGLWRDYNPEDTVRFMALRLHEAGLIEKTPNEFIAGFTDRRFIEEINENWREPIGFDRNLVWIEAILLDHHRGELPFNIAEHALGALPRPVRYPALADPIINIGGLVRAAGFTDKPDADIGDDGLGEIHVSRPSSRPARRS